MVFKVTKANVPKEAPIWTSFKDKGHFDKWFSNFKIHMNYFVIKEGANEEDAIEMCSTLGKIDEEHSFDARRYNRCDLENLLRKPRTALRIVNDENRQRPCVN